MTLHVSVDRIADPWTLGSALAEVRKRLNAAGIETADREAYWLIQHALGLSSAQFIDRTRAVAQSELARIDDYVNRRAAREPLQYILGTQEFCGLEFEVTPAVLIPRPETELLVQEVIRRLPRGGRPILVDVGTGSGCLAVSLARALPDVKVVAADLSVEALEIAKRNARRHGVETAICWLEGDLFAALPAGDYQGSVTAIVSNPPYIGESEWSGLQPEVSGYEPRMALVAGPKGTEVHERLLDEAVSYLVPGGCLVMELGQGQSGALRTKIEAMPAYGRVEIMPDEAGIDRILIVERAR